MALGAAFLVRPLVMQPFMMADNAAAMAGGSMARHAGTMPGMDPMRAPAATPAAHEHDGSDHGQSHDHGGGDCCCPACVGACALLAPENAVDTAARVPFARIVVTPVGRATGRRLPRRAIRYLLPLAIGPPALHA